MRLPRRIAGGVAAIVMVGLAALAANATGSAAPSGGSSGRSLPASVERSADCGSLQARIDATPTGTVLDLTGCHFQTAEAALVPRAMTVRGGTISAAGEGLRIVASNVTIADAVILAGPDSRGIVVAADDVTLDGITVSGRQSRRFSYREVGVFVHASAAMPVRGLVVRNAELADLGGYGAYLRHVAGFVFEQNRVHDIVYAGVMVLSGRDGRIERNLVQRIGVHGSEANGDNAYGIALTRGPGDGATDPVSSDIAVDRNTVEDVPTWNGLDTHAGRRIAFTNNTVRASARAVFVTTDGDGDNRASDVTIAGNLLAAPDPVGRHAAAVTLYAADGVVVTLNVARGWPNFLRDLDDLSRDVVVRDNSVSP